MNQLVNFSGTGDLIQNILPKNKICGSKTWVVHNILELTFVVRTDDKSRMSDNPYVIFYLSIILKSHINTINQLDLLLFTVYLFRIDNVSTLSQWQ